MNREMIKDIAAGVIGGIAVCGLTGISIVELLQHLPFTEPGSLTAIAMASLAYFFGRVTGETATATQQKSTEALQAMNGNAVKPTSTAV